MKSEKREMNVVATNFNGLFVLEPRVLGDSRGYFMEAYNRQTFRKHGIDVEFVQDNQSLSSKNVVRGLHFQHPPYAQSKLVRVLSGVVLDIVLDLRRKEPTFGQHFTMQLSAENKKQLLVPKGFAHGFLVLSDTAEVFYKCDEFYHPESDSGVHYTSVNIEWPDKLMVSEKDLGLPHFTESKFNF